MSIISTYIRYPKRQKVVKQLKQKIIVAPNELEKRLVRYDLYQYLTDEYRQGHLLLKEQRSSTAQLGYTDVYRSASKAS